MLSRILDIIQDSFPIVERPYAVLAEKLSALNVAEHAFGEDSSGPLKCAGGSNITEQSVFEAVESLRASGVIRRIGGVYDSRKLGYISRLCAGKVPTSELDFSEPRGGRAPTAMEAFAAAVNKIPAITHNYVRSHEYNVWFTVIAESEQEVSSIIDRLCAETSLHDVHAMAAKRMFKINTVMGLDERRKTKDERLSSSSMPDAQEKSRFGVEHHPQQSSILQPSSFTLHSPSNLEARRATSYLTTESDKLRVRLLSGDIPHSLTPFTDLCGACGCELHELLEGIRGDLAARRMRRFGAILRHQEAGFAHNAMVCFLVDSRQWLGIFDSVDSENNGAAHCDEKKVSERNCNPGLDLIAEVGEVLAANPHVSHCYERTPFEGFPYNVYAMFHATSFKDLEALVESAAREISSRGGDGRYAVLRSVRELKKTSFSFFS